MTDAAATPTDSSRPGGSDRIRSWMVITGAYAFVAFVALALLATIVVPNVLQKFAVTDCSRSGADILAIERALTEYAIANGGRYPSDLVPLVTPDMNGNTFLDCERVPLDPWGREYVYVPPGPGNPKPRVVSFGKDGRPGGDGLDADMDSDSIRREP